MFQFIESIKYLNGHVPLLNWHEQRFAATQFYAFGTLIYPSLADIIEMNTPEDLKNNTVYKCRIEYDAIGAEVAFIPYKQKKINHLISLHADHVEYPFKYADRSVLENLKKGIHSDSEILIIKNNVVTETTFTNVALFDGNNWLTPDTPLLEGVQRAFLIDKGILIPTTIQAQEVKFFSKIRLFNAMVDWDNAWEFPVKSII